LGRKGHQYRGAKWPPFLRDAIAKYGRRAIAPLPLNTDEHSKFSGASKRVRAAQSLGRLCGVFLTADNRMNTLILKHANKNRLGAIDDGKFKGY
jgi:hypothetical protein